MQRGSGASARPSCGRSARMDRSTTSEPIMTGPRRRSFVAAAVVAMLFGGVRAGADGNDMDPLLEATLQLKVQSYDHNITNRLAKGFVVCIIYRAGSSPSESAA